MAGAVIGREVTQAVARRPSRERDSAAGFLPREAGEGDRVAVEGALRSRPEGSSEAPAAGKTRRPLHRGGKSAALFALLFQLEYSNRMSATRLLVLGAVRIFQPIHGYDLRRELMSWHADEWANISFGSIYFALKRMTGDRLLEEVETGRSGGGRRRRCIA